MKFLIIFCLAIKIQNRILLKQKTDDNIERQLQVINKKLLRKLKVFVLADRIRKNAAKNFQKVKKILIPKKLRKKLHLKSNQEFLDLVRNKNFKQKFRKLMGGGLSKGLGSASKMAGKAGGVGGIGGAGGDATSANKDAKFHFSPNFAGMPFPPFLLNGPHFHPPINVTINTLPHPNSRAGNFYQIAQNNARQQCKLKRCNIQIIW